MSALTQHWAGKALAIRPEALAAMLHADALAPASAPEASRFVGERRAGGVARLTSKGTAILTIDGALVNRGMLLGEFWGVVTYEGLAFKLAAVARDPKVRAVILDMESPGGEFAGVGDLTAMVRKINTEKPVYAIVNGMAASAAYAIASGARAIISIPSGMSGSIGIVLLHADHSRKIDKAGVSPTLIHAGAHKVDGNPYTPLTKEVRSDLQDEVDRYYGQFLGIVAAGRGTRLTADAAKATEARSFIGADAKAAGLVDDVGSFAELVEAIERRIA